MIFRAKLEGLSFHAIIGILPHERRTPQKVIVDAIFEYEGKANYIDYAKAAKLLRTHIQQERFLLLEDALQSSAALLKKHFPQMRHLTLTIKKPQILDDATPSVTLSLNFG